MSLPFAWDQIASLGAGGAVAVIILYIVLNFLEKRSMATAVSFSTMQRTIDKSIMILDQQTKILDKIADVAAETRDRVMLMHERIQKYN